MQATDFIDALGTGFYAGVPDSKLRIFVDCLIKRFGINNHEHVIGANEGNCVALAAGYYLATGHIPAVYLQNSGIGNIVNPVVSLMHQKVYGIPCIFIIGWRGEPELHDEPQHIVQGRISQRLLADLGIRTYILDNKTTAEDVKSIVEKNIDFFKIGGQIGFLVKKGAFQGEKKIYINTHIMLREQALAIILERIKDDWLVATTGKTSREIYEIRKKTNGSHDKDFLVVGSMGHASSIALGIALQHPEKRIWCIDGDGAAIMHMGSMAIIGSMKVRNIIHVLINNGAHESVGGHPTAGQSINFLKIADACGYTQTMTADTEEALRQCLSNISDKGRVFLQVKTGIGARKDLGRPDVSLKQAGKIFSNTFKNDI